VRKITDRHIKVLLIEDNPGDARLIKEMLFEVNTTMFDVECAERLSSGLSCLALEDINVVLLDLGLPDSTGLDTFIKVHDQAPEVPIIMLTGLDDEALSLEGVRMGAQDYLTKSKVDGDLLVRAIYYAIERKAADEALQESEERLRIVIENMPVMLDAFDENGKIIVWNSECEKVTGYNSNEIIGNTRAVKLLYPDGKNLDYIYTMLQKYGNNFRNLEWDITCKDGSIKTILWSNISEKYPIPNWYSWAIGIDITERKKAQDQIERSLKEKEVLLKEIHHRVKNNLQVISSLLNMQARTTKDTDTINILSESRDRITTMSIIHTQLYESRDLSKISIKEFINRLLGQLLQSYHTGESRITPVIRVEECLLSISIAVPVGLIVNELLSNAIKYAFVGREEGVIEIILSASQSGRVNLMVSDDGVGLPHGLDIDTNTSLGLRLVKLLTEDQLQGKLDIISEKGTTFIIEFNI